MADNDDETVDTLDMLKDWTLDVIYAETRDVLKRAHVVASADLMERLQYYRVVDHPEKLVPGAHLCYIKKDNLMHLHVGIFCKINHRVGLCGTWLVCKNYSSGRPIYYQICYDSYVIFQRFTRDQQILIESAELLL